MHTDFCLMDGKRRQYVPPALGGSPASIASTTAAAAAQRLISLRNSARPPESSPPTQTFTNAQVLREKTTTDMQRCTPSPNLGNSQALVPAIRDGEHSDNTTTPTPFTTTGLPRTYRDNLLSLPRPRSYVASPLAPPVSSSSPAPASVAAAAAAAALLKIRNRAGNSTTLGTVTIPDSPSLEKMTPSSSRHLAGGPLQNTSRSWTSPKISLRRPPSVVAATCRPMGEEHERSHAPTASTNMSPQYVLSSSSAPTPSLSDAPGSEMELRQEVLGLSSRETGYSDVVGPTSVPQAGLKRPRDLDFPSISDGEDGDEGDGGHGGTNSSQPAFQHSSSTSSAYKASALPLISNGVNADFPAAPPTTKGPAEGSAARPFAVCTGFLSHPGVGEARTGPQSQHPLGPTGLSQQPPQLSRATTSSDEDAGQVAFDHETEVEDAVADDESAEEDGGDNCRSVAQSDPLSVVVDLAHVRRVAARAKAAASAPSSSDGALQQAEEAEAMLTHTQKGSELPHHAKQDNTNSCSRQAERDARDVARTRALLEKRAWADIHRRATQVATTLAPPSELLLDLLQHLPNTPSRAIYDRSSCPPTATASGFSEDFHKCVQQFMTHIVLQRDGRTGDAQSTSVSHSDAAAPQQASTPPRHRCNTLQKGTKQKQKEGETEQLIETIEKGIAEDVRDVVAYARFVMQERLHQGRRRGSKRPSPLPKTALSESEEVLCPAGDIQTPEENQQLSELRVVIEKKLSLIRASAEATNKEGDYESATLHTKRSQSKGGIEDDTNAIVGGTDSALKNSKEMFVAAHTRFMDVVRSAAASRREKMEAAQLAEQKQESTVAAWRKLYDKLLTRALNRHFAEKRPDKQSRTEALLQALQPQQEKHRKRQHHQTSAGLWEMAKGMRKKERKHLSKLVKAAANSFPFPPFQYPPAPPRFS
ncbi:hypothetical protein, conserved [Leishmania tarentolae]|uniref:Uncharacterized protein n=1 Tax=Leishmania tarentolae TaxID=5689 RepID=A0A640KUT1_LEITA|nr:hypothetical protein, conserved [Leishmania tarentolae]